MYNQGKYTTKEACGGIEGTAEGVCAEGKGVCKMGKNQRRLAERELGWITTCVIRYTMKSHNTLTTLMVSQLPAGIY